MEQTKNKPEEGGTNRKKIQCIGINYTGKEWKDDCE